MTQLTSRTITDNMKSISPEAWVDFRDRAGAGENFAFCVGLPETVWDINSPTFDHGETIHQLTVALEGLGFRSMQDWEGGSCFFEIV